MFDNRKKNLPLILAVALLCAIVVFFAVYTKGMPSAEAGMKHIDVEVIHGDGSSKTFYYDTDAEFLGDALEGLIEGEQGQFGMYVHVVDGERAVYEDDGAYWALMVDGEYAAQGIDMTPVTDGGGYALVYTVD